MNDENSSAADFANRFNAPNWMRVFPAAMGLFIVVVPVFALHLPASFLLCVAGAGIAKWRLGRRLRSGALVNALTGLALTGICVALYGARIDGAIASFLAIFTLAIWTGGFELIRTAIEAEAQRWTLSDGALAIHRRNLLGEGRTIIRAADLAAALVDVCPQDDGPDTYVLRLRLHGGETFETGAFMTRKVAEKKLAELSNALGLD